MNILAPDFCQKPHCPQIIAHHNAVLGDWFVTAKDEGSIFFEEW